MLYLLGTDEAGYGPNLGPLVVAASLWRVSSKRITPPDLYECLADAISADGRDNLRIAIADSKQLYSSGSSLRLLERGVLSALRSIDREVVSWREAWQTLSGDGPCSLPWYIDYDSRLPLHATTDELALASTKLSDCFKTARIELVDLRACLVHPEEFNQGCLLHDSKGAVLSQATLSLARSMMSVCHDGPVYIYCDKHGGRNHYSSLVWEELAAHEDMSGGGFPVQIVRESRSESIYQWRRGEFKREIRFVAKGERFLPAALASMTAKYLRELAMAAFNSYWLGHFPDLAPTAGYPGDAARFRDVISAKAAELSFAPATWWRER